MCDTKKKLSKVVDPEDSSYPTFPEVEDPESLDTRFMTIEEQIEVIERPKMVAINKAKYWAICSVFVTPIYHILDKLGVVDKALSIFFDVN